MAPFRRLRTRLGLRKSKALPQMDGLSIGRHTYGLTKSSLYSVSEHSPLVIGSYCSIAKEVVFICHGRHDPQFTTTYPIRQNLFGAPLELESGKRGIHVGNDVWFGRRAMIMPGVAIGDGAVIGAGSVVTRDVPSYTVYAGNPARMIRRRFSEDVAQALLAIKWWDWPEDVIRKNSDLLQGPIDLFIAECRSAE